VSQNSTTEVKVATTESEPRDIQPELYRVQARWEPWKALAAIIAASAVFAGGVLTLANYIGHSPQTINVHMDGPLKVP
jgi:hypothetical protein